KIPVFHGDQQGNAIVTAAAVLNALKIAINMMARRRPTPARNARSYGRSTDAECGGRKRRRVDVRTVPRTRRRQDGPFASAWGDRDQARADAREVGLDSRAALQQPSVSRAEARVDMLTVGQYLQPRAGNLPVRRYVTPEAFAGFERDARAMGFLHAACGPLVRSRYHAGRRARRWRVLMVAGQRPKKHRERARVQMHGAKKPLYRSLYFHVIVAIVIGVLLGSGPEPEKIVNATEAHMPAAVH